MTYVDDDDFDDVEIDHGTDDELRKDEAGRCDECGLKVKKDDALICPMCSAVYHRWCVTECNVCKTPLEGEIQEKGNGKNGKNGKSDKKKVKR